MFGNAIRYTIFYYKIMDSSENSLAFSPALFTSWQITELGNTSNYSSVRSGSCQKLQQASSTFLQWWSALGALGTKTSREKCISLIQAVVHHLEPILFRAAFLGVLFWVYLHSISLAVLSPLSSVYFLQVFTVNLAFTYCG